MTSGISVAIGEYMYMYVEYTKNVYEKNWVLFLPAETLVRPKLNLTDHLLWLCILHRHNLCGTPKQITELSSTNVHTYHTVKEQQHLYPSRAHHTYGTHKLMIFTTINVVSCLNVRGMFSDPKHHV